MAYTPTTWNTGDTITATKLNKLENGVANAGSALIVTTSLVNSVQTMDKTVQEIYGALTSGTPVYLKYAYGVASDYVSRTFLAPITNMFTYNAANVIRIAVNVPMYANSSISGEHNLYSPAVYMFQASGMNSYPTFLKSVHSTLATTEATSTFF